METYYICKVCRRVRCYFISHAFYVHVLMLSYYPLWILNSAKLDMSLLVRNDVHTSAYHFNLKRKSDKISLENISFFLGERDSSLFDVSLTKESLNF